MDKKTNDSDNGCVQMTAKTPILGRGKASRLANSDEYVITELTTLECSDGKVRRAPQRIIGKHLKQDEMFETLFTPIEELDFIGNVKYSFGKALELLEEGKKVGREGWNGKAMFLSLVPANRYQVEEMLGQPRQLPWIGMKTADNCFVPWLASQTDMLTKDWILINT